MFVFFFGEFLLSAKGHVDFPDSVLHAQPLDKVWKMCCRETESVRRVSAEQIRADRELVGKGCALRRTSSCMLPWCLSWMGLLLIRQTGIILFSRIQM